MRLSDLIEPFRKAEGPPPGTLGQFILWCLKGAMPILALATVVTAMAGTLEVMTAFLLGTVIDSAIETGEAFFAERWLLLLLVAGFFLILRPLVFGASAALQGVAIGPNLNPLILSRLNRYALGHSVEFFDNDFAGRIAQKQMQVSRAVTDVVIELINVVAFAAASVIGSAVLLLTIDWRIALALGFWLGLYAAMIRWFMPRVRLRAKARAGARAMVTGQIVDTVTNIKTVKLFAHAEYEDMAALDALAHWRGKAVRFGELAALFRITLMGIAGLVPVVLVGGTLMLWTGGTASAGDIAVTGAVALRIAQMTGWVSFVLMGLYANIGEIEDGINTLTPPHSLVDAPDAKEMNVSGGEIVFDAATFAYGRETGGVEAIDLTIAPGEKLGIVGASGAGKSTLVSLLLRLYDAESGRILIDGQDVAKVTQESLRRNIGMVTQETAMFNRSARENILYGRPDASDDDMIDAAKRAEAHEFILELQDHNGRKGYDAHLGERGVKLSGGQRQRIALARAILKDAPILVLDEATSALDSEVEASIQAALERVMQGKTVLAIAHRLSTIAQMDRIVVLDRGRIVEQGSHVELLALRGLYARFWNRQSGGFIGIQEAAE